MAPKIVVITGCSSGIGLATAVLLAKDDNKRFKVFATMRNLAKKEKLCTAAGSVLDNTLFIRELDVTKEDSIVDFMEQINRDEGGIDILINNAGRGQMGLFEKVSMDEIRGLYETNVFGLFRVTQAVIPKMKAKKSGHIINVSSIAGLIGCLPYFEYYNSTKFAVEGFSESIAALLQPFNISVSVIEPGPVATEFQATSVSSGGGFDLTTPTDDNPLGVIVNEDVDDMTREHFTKTIAGFAKRVKAQAQTGEDIALVIKEAILSDKPHLHYLTSDSVKAATAMKYKDPTGDSVVQMIAGRNKQNLQS